MLAGPAVEQWVDRPNPSNEPIPDSVPGVATVLEGIVPKPQTGPAEDTFFSTPETWQGQIGTPLPIKLPATATPTPSALPVPLASPTNTAPSQLPAWVLLAGGATLLYFIFRGK